MSNLTRIPLQDGFQTTLNQEWDGAVGDINVNNTPDFTFPAGVTGFIVVNPTNELIQIAEIDSYDPVLKTISVSDITLNKGASIPSTAQLHPVNSDVIISDNYEFWEDIRVAILSKVGKDETNDISTGVIRLNSTTIGQLRFQNVTTIQRTALSGVLGATDNVIIKDTTDGEHYKWNGTAFDPIQAGSTQPNATELVDGKVRIATPAQVAARTPASGSGTKLVVTTETVNIVGEIKLWPTATPPAGWLLCDGDVLDSVLDTTLADLFSVIGTTFGGTGADDFNLPDTQGKTIVGQDAGDTDFDAMGETGGAKTHTLLEAEIPAHTHTIDTYDSIGGNNNRVSNGETQTLEGAAPSNSTGGGGAHNNVQPYLVLNYIIKT